MTDSELLDSRSPRDFTAARDGDPESDRANFAALDMLAQLPSLRRLKAWALERLDPQPGMKVLDVGCGTGEDAQGLALTVGPTGTAVGVDASEGMIAEARRRAAVMGSAATFETASADSLPFAEASFDLVRSERLLQHVTRPEDCVGHMARVLGPGGILALIDTDWRTLTVWPGEPTVTDAIRDAWLGSSANPAAGAQLPDLLGRAGLTVVAVTTDVVLMRSRRAADEPPVTMMVSNAVRSGALSQAAADEWLSEVRSAAARGGFLGMVTVVAASARKP